MSFRCLIVLLFPFALQAAPMETMAWHFAVMPSFEFPGEGREMVDAPSDGQPSVTSIFIAKDQKLTDLSEPFRKRCELGNDSWLVWNESRKLLIAHGTPIALWQVEKASGYMRQPRQVAVTISWYLGVDPGKPIPPDLKPLHSTTIVGRSRQKTLFTWASPVPARLMSVDIESESTIGDDDRVADSDFLLDWDERVNGKTYSWHYNASTVMRNASTTKKILAQADSPAGGSWTLTAESSIQLTDGHPVAEGRLLESAGKEISSFEYPRFIATRERMKIQTSKGEMLLQAFPAWELFRDITNSTEIEVDPFSSNPSGLSLKKDGMQIASIPEELKPWFPPRLVDVKAQIKGYGINFPENGLAGFDFTSGLLFAAGFNVSELDLVEQLTAGGCRLRPHLVTIVQCVESSNKENERQSQKALIACLTGRKSLLTCYGDEEPPLFSFEVEPTLGDDDRIMDLRFKSKRKEPAHLHDSSISLPVGVEVKSSETITESGEQLTQSLKAFLLPWPGEENASKESNPSD